MKNSENPSLKGRDYLDHRLEEISTPLQNSGLKVPGATPRILLPGQNNALIQFPLEEQEIKQLTKEFPELNFVPYSKLAVDIPQEIWGETEIFFGERLSENNLAQAKALRWIHTPSSFIQSLSIKEVKSRENILISFTPETNTFQIGEYVIASVLAFAKNLFHWKATDQFPLLIWDSKWRNNMWSLKDKVFLQIGLGKSGLSIAERASLAGMKVWGVDKIVSTYPFCQKTFSYNQLHELLPRADVVSLTIPFGTEAIDWKIGKKELALMKNDSILSILGTSHHIDEDALHEFSTFGKFRGILLDAYYQTAISPASKLWSIPNILLTPGIAPRPKNPDREAFKVFRFNLRQYLSGNFYDMEHLVDPALADLSDI